MSHRVRCSICDGIAVDYCSMCKKPVCSICMNEDGICKRCSMYMHDMSSMDDSRGEERSSFRIGYTALRDVVNIHMLLIGIVVIIVGMILISYASMSMVDMLNQIGQRDGLSGTDNSRGGGSGVVVIFPFPFLIFVQDAGILTLIILLVILVPFILFFLLFRRGFRIPN